jgi:hypothetical protein
MKFLLDWLKGIADDMFEGGLNIAGRDLTNVPIFGGEGGSGGFFGAFGEGATGLFKLIGQVNFLAAVVGAGLLFFSLFLCVYGLVQASINGDPHGIAEARTGIITCFVSLGLINAVPIITGIIYRLAAS